ncbi:MAG: hypothetical protein P1V18_06165 [Candidatus Gracilibacteria bacterium]|nr:hypothetical protein [Candidatus Gracilibacteria bacterium]
MYGPLEDYELSIPPRNQQPLPRISSVSYASESVPDELEESPDKIFLLRKMREYLNHLKELSPPDLPLLKEFGPLLERLFSELQDAYKGFTGKDDQFQIHFLMLGDQPNAFVFPGLKEIVFSYELLVEAIQYSTVNNELNMNRLEGILWEIIGHEMGHIYHGSFHHEDVEAKKKRIDKNEIVSRSKKWTISDTLSVLEERSYNLTIESTCDEFGLQLRVHAKKSSNELLHGLKLIKRIQDNLKARHRRKRKKVAQAAIPTYVSNLVFASELDAVEQKIDEKEAQIAEKEYTYKSRIPSVISTHPEIHWRIKQLEDRMLRMDFDPIEYSLLPQEIKSDFSKVNLDLPQLLDDVLSSPSQKTFDPSHISQDTVCLLTNVMNLSGNIPTTRLRDSLFRQFVSSTSTSFQNLDEIDEVSSALKADIQCPQDALIWMNVLSRLNSEENDREVRFEHSLKILLEVRSIFMSFIDNDNVYSLSEFCERMKYLGSEEVDWEAFHLLYMKIREELPRFITDSTGKPPEEKHVLQVFLNLLDEYPDILSYLLLLQSNHRYDSQYVNRCYTFSEQRIAPYFDAEKMKEDGKVITLEDFGMAREYLESEKSLFDAFEHVSYSLQKKLISTIGNRAGNLFDLSSFGLNFKAILHHFTFVSLTILDIETQYALHREKREIDDVSGEIDFDLLIGLDAQSFQYARSYITRHITEVEHFSEFLHDLPSVLPLFQMVDGESYTASSHLLLHSHREYIWSTLAEYCNEHLDELLIQSDNPGQFTQEILHIVHTSDHPLVRFIDTNRFFLSAIQLCADDSFMMKDLAHEYYEKMKETMDLSQISQWKPFSLRHLGRQIFVPAEKNHQSIAQSWLEFTQFMESFENPRLHHKNVLALMFRSWFLNLEQDMNLHKAFFLTLHEHLDEYMDDTTPLANQWLLQFAWDQRFYEKPFNINGYKLPPTD